MGPKVIRDGVRKYKIVVQYVGTSYHGWQIQRNQRTVQGVINDALSRLAGQPIHVAGASRTDSGVHALGQVAHFRFPPKETITDLRRALNAILPSDIRILRLTRVAGDFHAQRNASRKRYEYRIYNGKVLSPFSRGRVCHILHPLDFQKMQKGARRFLGSHDFTSFAASSTAVRNRVRKVSLSEMRKRGSHLTYRVEADGFLHHMVRNMAGTLLEIGLGQRAPSGVTTLLESGDRRLAGSTAPPDGLYLVRIWY